MAECFCYLCKVMFSNGAMWNIRLFPEPIGTTIKKSGPLTNPSTTILWLSVISLKPSFLFLPLSIALGTFISYASFAVFTPKPSAWQGRDWPGSSFLKIDLTKKAFPDWISLTTHLAITPPARKLADQIQCAAGEKSPFPDWPPNKQKPETSFEKVYLLAFQCLPITADAMLCILHIYRDISSVKTSQEIMIFKDKKNYINFVQTCSYSGPSILEKTKETKAI